MEAWHSLGGEREEKVKLIFEFWRRGWAGIRSIGEDVAVRLLTV